MTSRREPILNIPAVVVLVVVLVVAIHAVMWGVLSPAWVDRVLMVMAFIPARYDGMPFPDAFPGGFGAQVWTFVTYAFFHADLNHLVFNTVWMVAFGTPVARRFGSVRFLLFFAFCAIAGAALHLATHAGEFYPVIGASAAISGFMAGALRFIFHGGGALGMFRSREEDAYRFPAPPLRQVLFDPRVFAFIAVWFGINLIIGVLGVSMTGIDQPVAWEAHIGGFVAGLLGFSLFDPVPRGSGGALHRDATID